MKIAVDIDGVLADQVGAVLRVIEKEYGLKYRKSDVNCAHWTFSGMEIWSEIARLLADQEYTLNIPMIEGSQKGVKQFVDHNGFCCAKSNLIKKIYVQQMIIIFKVIFDGCKDFV